MLGFKNLFRPAINIPVSSGLVADPPRARRLPEKRTTVSAELALRSPTTSERSSPGNDAAMPSKFDDGARRINVPMMCSVRGDDYIVRFRKNRYSGRAIFESTEIPSASSGPADTSETYDQTDLDFSRAKCPHCRSSAGPVKCTGCERFVCRGGLDRATSIFYCPCGYSGELVGGLRTITGSEGQAAPQGSPLLGRKSTAQRLGAPTRPQIGKRP
jgi:hypothetical protein